MDTYFRQQKDGKWTPRSILADYDPESIQGVMKGSLGEVYDQENAFSGINGTIRTFADAHYNESKYIMDSVKDSIRREVEKCDSMQGVQLVSGIGGGTGSGLATSILVFFREDYPDKTVDFTPIYPSLGDELKAFEIYNW